MKRTKGRSALLNLPGHHGTAAIAAVFQEEEASWQNVIISDCDRKITLSMEMDSQDSWNNSMHKLDTLIDCLSEFRRAYKSAGKRKRYEREYE